MYHKCHRALGWCKSCTRCSRTGHCVNRAILQTAIFHHTTHLDWMVPDYLDRSSNTYLWLFHLIPNGAVVRMLPA
jgi:hypothetical protein